jgi:hypothetical protein
VFEVGIDIVPGSLRNTISLQSKGLIPVGILSGADFDAASEVDVASLTFGRTGEEDSLAFCLNPRDINGDGIMDFACFFDSSAANFEVDDIEGVLKGRTIDAALIVGSDSVSKLSIVGR